MESPRLIVVDVFARVKGSKGAEETDYDADYRQAAMLQALASRHNLAVVLIHHTRKMAADDPFDEVSGTRGLTGAADSVLVLKRDGGTQQPVLYGRGCDLEEIETALQFDKENGHLVRSRRGMAGRRHDRAARDSGSARAISRAYDADGRRRCCRQIPPERREDVRRRQSREDQHRPLCAGYFGYSGVCLP